jgi:putative SbcD/Mre11-related phosphoesterase
LAARIGLHPIADWLLTPERAIVHPVERTAVIADVHLGYEWARGNAGDSIPAHSLNETLVRLDRLFDRVPDTISTLIVAGDLVESRRLCRRTAENVRQLRLWLDRRGVEFVLLAGNHDPQRSADVVRGVAGWTIGHGHQPILGERVISGHIHPVFRLAGLTAPCFVASETRVVLPAFSNNAAGLDILARPELFDIPGSNPRCLVITGDEILDFGPINDLICQARLPRSFVQGRRK